MLTRGRCSIFANLPVFIDLRSTQFMRSTYF